MKKLIKKQTTNIVTYQPFLKKNFLKKNQFKLKNILFENKILYKNLNLETYVIEFNNYENIYLPFTLIKIDEISTIILKYKNVLLFSYDVTYNILYQFNKLMFKNILNKKNNIIKGRLLGGTKKNKKILLSILGFVFSMKSFNLNKFLNYKKQKYLNKLNKKNFYKNKINSIRLINCYKLKYLNYTIHNIDKKFSKKIYFSRITYIQSIIKNQKIKKKKNMKKNKSVLSIKKYVK